MKNAVKIFDAAAGVVSVVPPVTLDTAFTADLRAAADTLEKVVADDLWPLPKYSEILFVK